MNSRDFNSKIITILMIPLICGVLFFQGDKKINCFGNMNEKKKIACDGGVGRRAKNIHFRVWVQMRDVGRGEKGRDIVFLAIISPYPCKKLR